MPVIKKYIPYEVGTRLLQSLQNDHDVLKDLVNNKHANQDWVKGYLNAKLELINYIVQNIIEE